MPLITQDEAMLEASLPKAPQEQDTNLPKPDETAGTFETIGAAFRKYTTPGAVIDRATNNDLGLIKTENFNPYQDQEALRGYEDYLEAFATADTADEVDTIKARIDRENKDNEIINSSGLTGTVAAFGVQLIDPVNYLPIFNLVNSAKKGAALAGAVNVGTSAVASSAVQEGVLQGARETTTAEESAAGVIGAGIVGGLLGGVVGAAGAHILAKRNVEEILNTGKESKIELDDSVGAARVAGGGEDIANLNARLAKYATAGLSPVVRGLTNPLNTMKEATNSLFAHNFILKKGYEGKAAPVSLEAQMNIDAGDAFTALKKVKDSYANSLGLKGKLESIQGGKFKEFSEKIAFAMRRGDESSDPLVAQAAKTFREQMDTRLKMMQERGLIGDDVNITTARSYLTRRWNRDVIRAPGGREKLFNILEARFRTLNPNKDLDEIQIDANNTINNILGQGDVALGMEQTLIQAGKGSGTKLTKQRILDIADEEVEEFLVNDSFQLFADYMRGTSGLIRHHDWLENLKHTNNKDLRVAIRDEAEDLRLRDPANAKKYSDAAEEALRDLDKFVGALLGTGRVKHNEAVATGLRTLRTWNTLALLGGVTISSMTDMAQHITQHGLPRALSGAMLQLGDWATKNTMTKDALWDLINGAELEGNNILRILTDATDAPATQTAVDRIASGTLGLFGKLTLMDQWNTMHRRMAVVNQHNRTLRVLRNWEKTGKIDKKELERFSRIRIGQEHYKPLLETIAKFSDNNGNSNIPNIENWPSEELRRVYINALKTEMDATVITPGKGDVPIAIQNNEWLKVLTQFQSFAMAVNNKVLVSGLQRRDAEVVTGIVTAIALGGLLVYPAKEIIAGRTPDLTPENVILEGLTRSGVLGLMGDKSLSFFGAGSRWARSNFYGDVFGVSANRMSEMYSLAAKVKNGEGLSERDRKTILSFMPYANLFYLKWLLTQLGD